MASTQNQYCSPPDAADEQNDIKGAHTKGNWLPHFRDGPPDSSPPNIHRVEIQTKTLNHQKAFRPLDFATQPDCLANADLINKSFTDDDYEANPLDSIDYFAVYGLEPPQQRNIRFSVNTLRPELPEYKIRGQMPLRKVAHRIRHMAYLKQRHLKDGACQPPRRVVD